MGWLLFFPELLAALVVGIYELLRAMVEWVLESVRPRLVERWNPFWDAGQTAAVRRWALRLPSRRRHVRVEAVERLGELGDPAAVPALLKAVEWYGPDVPMMQSLVGALRRIGDERAIPALRSLASGRHFSLMAAAREALAEIEPRASLLRASDSGNSGLLRASGGGDSGRLLRARGDSAGSPTG